MKRILIIDDDEEMCTEISEILRDEGFSVDTVNNGLLGLQLLNKETFDLLLLDLKIPGLTGFEILKNLREKKNNIKVIVLTGRPHIKNLPRELTEEENREEEILKSADFMIQKPFKINFLIEKVREI